MIFRINHQIRYIYAASVFLEPHILRLRPRNDASQCLRNFSATITPQPTGIHDFLDAEGNVATCLWFDEKVKSLEVVTSFEVETLQENAFGYLVTDNGFFQLPVTYGGNDGGALALYRGVVDLDQELQPFIQDLVDKAAGQTLDFLFVLNQAIYEGFTVDIREDGSPWPPLLTWQRKRGACRDLALLFIAACHSVGLAARFVSGYQEGEQGMSERYLHAWVEVYVPGGGWRGYDPTLGLVVADRHVVLAASYHPEGAAPITGTFRGTGITAQMEYGIDLLSDPL